MTITTAAPTCAVVFDAPTEYVDRGLATASWWDKYEILSGTYLFEWVDLDYRPWNADPERVTPGFIANIGPYYAQVTLWARLLEEYRVNQLLTASSAAHRVHEDPREVTLTRSVYAYQMSGCPKGQHGRPLTTFLGGRVVPVHNDGMIRLLNA